MRTNTYADACRLPRAHTLNRYLDTHSSVLLYTPPHNHTPTFTNHPLSGLDEAAKNKRQISYFISLSPACFSSLLSCLAMSEEQELNWRRLHFLKWNDCQLNFARSSKKSARKMPQSFYSAFARRATNTVWKMKGSLGRSHRSQMNHERKLRCLSVFDLKVASQQHVAPVYVIRTIRKCWHLSD